MWLSRKGTVVQNVVDGVFLLRYSSGCRSYVRSLL